MDNHSKMDLERILRNKEWLISLHKANNRQRKVAFKKSTNDQLDAFCECALNVLKKNVKLKGRRLTEMRKPNYRRLTYICANKKFSRPVKRQKLAQSGGFPLALLGTVLGSLFGSLISR